MDQGLRPTRSIRFGRRRGRSRGGLALTLAILAGLGFGLVTDSGVTAQMLARVVSPAEGHAQVIAQGVAAMPRVEVGWRVIGMEAQPIDDAPVAERSLGFVLAEGGTVFIEDQTTGTRTLLEPGEAALAQQGAYQRRSSLEEEPAEYFALELVVAEDLESEATIGDGDLIFAGDSFEAPRGDRDFNLVRDVLDEREDGEISTDTPALIFVTAGELTVVSDDDEATLDAGEAGVFSGDLELESDDGAVYVAAIIGAPVPNAQSADEDDNDVVVNDDRASDGEGGIILLAESCPPGTTLPDIQVTPCDRVLGGFEVVLTGELLDGFLTQADSGAGDAVYWAPLPFGTYTITFTALPDGHDMFYVFGSGDAGASAHVVGDGTGFTFTLDAALIAADPYYDDPENVLLRAIFVDAEATG